MAVALRSFGVRNDDSSISYLVVATGDLCEKISEGLLKTSRDRKCRVVVHRCESISEVVRLKSDLNVDFVVFAFDGRVRNWISEIETNVSLIDEHYVISGCACLINCTGISDPLDQTFAQARKICKKLNLSLMTRNLLDPDSIFELGDALTNLAEVRLGTKIGIPILPRPLEIIKNIFS